MQKYNILFFSLLLLCSACTGDKLPKGVIERDKMVNLLTQIHIADGTLFTELQVPDTLYKHGFSRFLTVFKNFHTDTNQFKKSMKYYCNQPEVLAVMYDEISDKIKFKSDSLNKVIQAQMQIDQKRRADSLKKLPKQLQNVQPATTVPVTPPTGKFNNHRFIPKIKPNAGPVE